MVYLRNYKTTDLWNKKQALFVAVRKETSEIAQPE